MGTEEPCVPGTNIPLSHFEQDYAEALTDLAKRYGVPLETLLAVVPQTQAKDLDEPATAEWLESLGGWQVNLEQQRNVEVMRCEHHSGKFTVAFCRTAEWGYYDCDATCVGSFRIWPTLPFTRRRLLDLYFGLTGKRMQ